MFDRIKYRKDNIDKKKVQDKIYASEHRKDISENNKKYR